MKYKNILLIFAFLFILIIIVCIYYIICPPNKNIDLQISDIKTKELTEIDLSDIKEHRIFYNDTKLSAKVADDIVSNPYEYIQLIITYDIQNSSEKVRIEDVRCNPIFLQEMQEIVIGYSDTDYLTYINCNPGKGWILNQPILIKKNGMSEEKIMQLAKECKVRLSYFTGPLVLDNGHGLYGLGKKTIVYNMNRLGI